MLPKWFSFSDEVPTDAAAVANEILKLGDLESVNINNDKLQCLMYYTQGWFLVNHGYPLFNESIIACSWGPVIQSVYNDFIELKEKPIKQKRSLLLDCTNPDEIGYNYYVAKLHESKYQTFVKSVWNTHKHLTDIQLLNSTHRPGEPWEITKKTTSCGIKDNPIIHNELIKSVFESKLKRYNLKKVDHGNKNI